MNDYENKLWDEKVRKLLRKKKTTVFPSASSIVQQISLISYFANIEAFALYEWRRGLVLFTVTNWDDEANTHNIGDKIG